MITSEKARKENNLMMENHVQLTKEKYDWCPQMVDRRKSHYQKIDDYITQQEELTTTVKRYFELKAKGITTEAEANEHRELLNKINEMVGIKYV